MRAPVAVRSPFGGWTQVRAREGELIRVEVVGRRLDVVVDGPGDASARASVPYPDAGYGGHELVLSPGERYLAMWLYSGQSEVGYELFAFRPSLRHIGSFPYVFGEGSAPIFSSDERSIALAWSTNPCLCLDDQDLDDDGLTLSELVIEWARVRIAELPDRDARTCTISVRLPPRFPFEGDDCLHPEHLELPSAHELRFATPWGELVRLPVPLPEAITIAGPTKRPR